MRYLGHDLVGPAGTVFRIPDSLRSSFIAEYGDQMPNLTWVTNDEIAAGGGSHPDLAAHDALGLATDAALTTHDGDTNAHVYFALDVDLTTHTAAGHPGLYAEPIHTHAESQVTSLVADLAAKAPVSHSHVDADIPAGIARDSEVTSAITTHEAAADPHAGYRLESADHTHASSGLQGGQVAYSSLTGTPAAERAAASTSPAAIGTAAVGVGTTDARADHVHATGAGTPSTQAFGDAAAIGTGPAAAMTDHKHALPANPVTAHEAAADPHTGYLKENDANYIDLTDGLATTLHSHAGGGDDARFLLQRLAAQQDSSATAPAKVTGLDRTLGVGTWIVEYFLRYRTSVAGTGVKFDLNHSGTVTSFVWWQYFTGLIATASDANADQDSVLAAGVPLNAFASRAKGTAGRGVTLSADTANADMFMRIEALVEVTVSGDIQLYFGSEATGSTQSLMVGSVGRFTKVA